MSDRPLGRLATQRLEAAGRLLCNAPGAPAIVPATGEAYAFAVLRTIRTLPSIEQERLKSHVDWVQDYGFDDDAGRPALIPRPMITPPPVIQSSAPVEPDYVADENDSDEDAFLQAMASVEISVPERPTC